MYDCSLPYLYFGGLLGYFIKRLYYRKGIVGDDIFTFEGEVVEIKNPVGDFLTFFMIVYV